MKIARFYSNLDKHLKPNKVLVIYGPRQVGKTTLLNDYLRSTRYKYRLDSGENIRIQELLSSSDFNRISDYASGYELIAIDEAQKIPNIGSILKIMVDHLPGIRIIATGSSSFELSGQIGEPLTGRKRGLLLFPIAQLELKEHFNPFDLKNLLPDFLIYGSYPEVVATENKKEKIEILSEISGSYLMKDLLELNGIKSSQKLIMILRLLAFQIGSEVSLNEIAQKVGLDYKTVGRYIDLLEKTFILYRLSGYSRNLRNEMTKKQKYFFYDTGIRNALIANFNPIELRNDVGQLWENFLFIERLKKQSYTGIYSNNYFWRTWSQDEIDFIEEREGNLYAYEFKWAAKTTKPPRLWQKTYPDSSFQVITPENYLDFIA